MFVLEKESPEVGLAAFHHVLDSCDDSRIANDDSLVETWEEWSACNWESKDVWVDFWDGLFSDRPGVRV